METSLVSAIYREGDADKTVKSTSQSTRGGSGGEGKHVRERQIGRQSRTVTRGGPARGGGEACVRVHPRLRQSRNVTRGGPATGGGEACVRVHPRLLKTLARAM